MAAKKTRRICLDFLRRGILNGADRMTTCPVRRYINDVCRREKESRMTEELLSRREGRVAVVTLNRPERLNALTRTMMRALLAELTACAADDAVGCVVLTGAGRAFCAGGDVRVQADTASHAPAGDRTPEQRADDLRASMEASRLLHEMPKPTIAMLNGVAAGAGLSLALACDMRIAGESARLTTAFAKVGLSGDYGGTWFLTRLVGSARARELYFASDVIDARQIDALGLANRVVPDTALEAEAMALASRLANGPAVALRYIKRNLNVAETGNLAQAFDSEAFGMLRCRQSEDHLEASRAFVEKRRPVFKGR
jgi:2-(1,2-epoxy-1,2-dihydrophenyl)acetyl-CoA isomerase